MIKSILVNYKFWIVFNIFTLGYMAYFTFNKFKKISNILKNIVKIAPVIVDTFIKVEKQFKEGVGSIDKHTRGISEFNTEYFKMFAKKPSQEELEIMRDIYAKLNISIKENK